jgi:hypothetical protein
MACQIFEEDPKDLLLFKATWLQEPRQQLTNEKLSAEKGKIDNGDMLILKGKDQLTLDEKLIIHIHSTKTGLSEDQTYHSTMNVSSKQY